jgi:hypothetical protein
MECVDFDLGWARGRRVEMGVDVEAGRIPRNVELYVVLVASDFGRH